MRVFHYILSGMHFVQTTAFCLMNRGLKKLYFLIVFSLVEGGKVGNLSAPS